MKVNSFTEGIKNRSYLHFYIGILPRLYNFLWNEVKLAIARNKGAKIGRKSSLPLKLANKSNCNLIIGDNSIIETAHIDLREEVNIGDNVIINAGVRIIRQSHNYDSEKFETIGSGLKIYNYAWITSDVLILPSCTSVGEGAIVAAGSVVVKNIGNMEIHGGNPARLLKHRNLLPLQLDNAALQGRNLCEYINARWK